MHEVCPLGDPGGGVLVDVGRRDGEWGGVHWRESGSICHVLVAWGLGAYHLSSEYVHPKSHGYCEKHNGGSHQDIYLSLSPPVPGNVLLEYPVL